METYQNLIRALVVLIGMSPNGIIAGVFGASALVFYGINGKMSLRFKIGVVFTSGTICGYLFRVLEEFAGWHDSLCWIACFVFGFCSPYFFRKLKSFAPAIFTAAGKKITKNLSDVNGNNGDPD